MMYVCMFVCMLLGFGMTGCENRSKERAGEEWNKEGKYTLDSYFSGLASDPKFHGLKPWGRKVLVLGLTSHSTCNTLI